MNTTTRIFLFAFSLLLLSSTVSLNAQVTIGAESAPQDFSVLELISTKGGLRLPQMSTEQRNTLTESTAFKAVASTTARGLLIYNVDTDCTETWNGNTWVSNCGTIASEAPTFIVNASGSNLPAFTNLNLTAGSSVTLKVAVLDYVDPTAQYTYQWYMQDIQDQYDEKSFVPMQGKTSDELTVTSTGSRSNVRYYCQVLKTGSSQTQKTGNCRVLVGGCGAYTGPNNTNWLEFQCHNLGALTTVDPFTPMTNIHGAYYQFGQATPVLDFYSAKEYYFTVPFTWPTPTLSHVAWPTASNPCGTGWKVLTDDYVTALLNGNSTQRAVGADWGTSKDNYSSGTAIGDYLFFPNTGWRQRDDVAAAQPAGFMHSRGYNALMWTNSSVNLNSATVLRLYHPHNPIAQTGFSTMHKHNAFNVRCVK